MDISRISAVAAVFDSLYGPACGSCGGGVVYGGNHCFGFYSCLYWNCAVALMFQNKGNPGRTDRICGSLRSEQAGYPERNAGSLCSDRPDGASFVDEPRVFIDLRGR